MALFSTANAAAMGAKGGRYHRPKPRTQILRMQSALLKDAENPALEPQHRAQCARAWDVLEERLRIMDGKPLPGQLRPDLEQQRKARSRKPTLLASMPTEPPSPGPAPTDPPQPLENKSA